MHQLSPCSGYLDWFAPPIGAVRNTLVAVIDLGWEFKNTLRSWEQHSCQQRTELKLLKELEYPDENNFIVFNTLLTI